MSLSCSRTLPRMLEVAGTSKKNICSVVVEAGFVNFGAGEVWLEIEGAEC